MVATEIREDIVDQKSFTAVMHHKMDQLFSSGKLLLLFFLTGRNLCAPGVLQISITPYTLKSYVIVSRWFRRFYSYKVKVPC